MESRIDHYQVGNDVERPEALFYYEGEKCHSHFSISDLIEREDKKVPIGIRNSLSSTLSISYSLSLALSLSHSLCVTFYMEMVSNVS